MEKIWFITGASQGLGLALAKNLLREGYKVAAATGDVEELQKEISRDTVDFFPIAVDLLDEDSVSKALYDTVKHFGKVDIIVNSAKYGLTGHIEELSDKETRRNFDINVFGTLNVVRAAMPYLREQASGHIFNIASVGGFSGDAAGFGIYRATELAVMGMSESLAAEVRPFGIKVTTVAPNYFRNNFLSATPLAVPKRRIAGYKPILELQTPPGFNCCGGIHEEAEQVTASFIRMAEQSEPSLFLFLGQGKSERRIQAGERMDEARELASWFHL